MDKLGFTFYPKDWWTSETYFSLSPIQRYYYLESLFIMYSNGGYMKTQKTQLENRLRTTISDDDFIDVCSLFTVEDNKYTSITVNKRLRKIKTNRENGVKGGRPSGEIDIFSKTGKKIPSEITSGHFIYLIYDIIHDEYKIGETQNLKKRRQTIKRPTKDLIVYDFDIKDKFSCINIERQVLSIFKDKIISGDWIKLLDRDVKVILNMFNSGENNPKNREKNPPSEREREREREIELNIGNIDKWILELKTQKQFLDGLYITYKLRQNTLGKIALLFKEHLKIHPKNHDNFIDFRNHFGTWIGFKIKKGELGEYLKHQKGEL